MVNSSLAPTRCYQKCDDLVVEYRISIEKPAGTERSGSDVDLTIIGRTNFAEIAPLLRILEEKSGRTVNVPVYTTKEFQKKVREKNHFTSPVLKCELIFVLGTADDLATC